MTIQEAEAVFGKERKYWTAQEHIEFVSALELNDIQGSEERLYAIIHYDDLLSFQVRYELYEQWISYKA